MGNKLIYQLEAVEPRGSYYDLNSIISKLSSINVEKSDVVSDMGEVILCLANEIKELKKEVSILKHK